MLLLLNNNHQLEEAESLMKELVAASQKTREVANQVLSMMIIRLG